MDISVLILVGIGCFVCGRWSKPVPERHRFRSSDYFHRRDEPLPVMSRWDADAIRATRRIH